MQVVKLMDNNFSTILGRKRLKISTVAKEAGISRTTLTSLYYGRTQQISLEVMDRLCRYLNCSIGDLFEISSEEESNSKAKRMVQSG